MRLLFSTLLLVVLIDGISAGIIYPIVPSLLFDPIHGLLFLNQNITLKSFYYGLVYGAFSLSYLIGMPTIGKLSDSLNKNKLMITCCLFLIIGHALTIWSIFIRNFVIFVMARSMVGFFSCNVILAQGIIASLYDDVTKKAARLSWSSLFFLSGFIIGPMITTGIFQFVKFKNTSFYLPFIIIIIALCLISILLAFSKNQSHSTITRNSLCHTVNTFIFFRQSTILNQLTFTYFLVNLVWGSLVQLTPLILSHYLHYNELNISEFYISLALASVIGVLLQTKALVYINFEKLIFLQISILALIFIVSISMLPKKAILFCGFSVPFIFISLNANLLALMSKNTPPSQQGALMGQKGYVSSASWLISISIFGFIVAKSLSLYFITLFLITIAALGTVFKLTSQKK